MLYFSFQIYNNVKLQIAATVCVSNLIWNKDEGMDLYNIILLIRIKHYSKLRY